MKTSRILLAFVVFGSVASSVHAQRVEATAGATAAVSTTIASLQAQKIPPMPRMAAPLRQADAMPAFHYPLVSGWVPEQATALAAGMSDFPQLPHSERLADTSTHTEGAIKAKTELAGKFEKAKSIAEPASEMLMLVALAALAIAVRRRLPG